MNSEPGARSPRTIAFVLVVGMLSSQLAEAGDVLGKVMAPMRDGTRLAAAVYLPDGEGPFPSVVARGVHGRGKESFALPFIFQGIAFRRCVPDCVSRGGSRSHCPG